MSQLVDLTGGVFHARKEKKEVRAKLGMSEEELDHLIGEIENKNAADPKAAINLLQLVLLGDQKLQTIEKIHAEKRIRRISVAPLTGSFSLEKENVKKKCRDLISKWGFLRRQQRLKEENPAFGNSFGSLMQRAEEMLKKKNETRQTNAFSEEKTESGKQEQKYRAYMIASTGMNYRDSIRKKLVDILRQAQIEIESSRPVVIKESDFGEPARVKVVEYDEWPLQCALRLEDEIYRLHKSGKPYVDKSRSVLSNLRDAKNPTARNKLILKELTPEDFLQVDVRKFATDEVKEQRAEAEKTNMYNKRTDWDCEEVKAQGDKFKGLFNCEGCGSNKTGFIQVQIDRADEPMTNFVFCYDCKIRFTK